MEAHKQHTDSFPLLLSPATSSLIGLYGRWRELSSLIGCAVSLHHVRYLYLRIFEILYIFFIYFWPSGFITVVIVNRRKTSRRKPRAACTRNAWMYSIFISILTKIIPN
jgi:hypothetical protein